MHIYLIRHAATQIDQTIDAKAWSLSEKGATQAQQLAACAFWKDIEAVVVSSEYKTYLTVEAAVARFALPVQIDNRLDEVQRGGFVEDYQAQVQQFFANPAKAINGWEAADDALARMNQAIADLAVDYKDQTVAVVSHGLILSLYRAYLLKHQIIRFEDWRALGFATVALVDSTQQQLLCDFQSMAEW